MALGPTFQRALLLIAAVASIDAVAGDNVDATMAETIRSSTGKVIGPYSLYDGEIPNSKVSPDEESHSEWLGTEIIQKVSRPTYTVYLPPPSRASGAAIIVLPGGGYSALSWDMEGRWIAAALQDRGIAGILVKYRLPNPDTMVDKSIAPLQDGQQAIRQTRRHATEWTLNPQKIGVIGFSAGGHLASLLGTSFETAVIPNPDSTSLKPNFLILVYPITSLSAGRLRKDVSQNLLGDHPSAAVIEKFSSYLHVTDRTPPTLILAASNDVAVGYDHAIDYYRALREHNIPAELVLFDRGQHGFFELSQEEWRAPMWGWLARNGMLSR